MNDDLKQELQRRRQSWITHVKQASKTLPTNLGKLTIAMVATHMQNKQLPYIEQSKLRKGQLAAINRLPDMSEQQVSAVFDTLFPDWSSTLFKAWLELPAHPYQFGSTRLALRDPQQPALVELRRQYLVQAAVNLAKYRLTLLEVISNELNQRNHSAEVGILLAAAIDAGGPTGDAVFERVTEVALGDHPHDFGRSIIVALLSASRVAGWEACERLLLAAQRQEGLRQVILEAADEGQPQAFRRMLGLISEQRLLRFNSVARAASVWLGLGWTVMKQRDTERCTVMLMEMLDSAELSQTLLAEPNPERVYIGLMAQGMQDMQVAFAIAANLLKSDDEKIRFVTTTFLGRCKHPSAWALLLPLLDDPSMHIANCVAQHLCGLRGRQLLDKADPSFRFETYAHRFPEREVTPAPLVWEWEPPRILRGEIYRAAFAQRGDRPLTEFTPYITDMSSNARHAFLSALGREKVISAELTPVIFKLIGDRSRYISESAVKLSEKITIEAADAPKLEAYLTRTAGGLRRGVIGMLLRLSDEEAFASAERLLGSKKIKQREAGLELLRELSEADRMAARAAQRVQAYADAKGDGVGAAERTLIEAVNVDSAETILYTLDDGLGLYDPSQLSPRIPPQKHPKLVKKPLLGDGPLQRGKKLLMALVRLVEGNLERQFTYKSYNSEMVESTLAQASNHIAPPKWELPFSEDVQRLPFAEIWLDWWQKQPVKLRGKGGMGAHWALAIAEASIKQSSHWHQPWEPVVRDKLFGKDTDTLFESRQPWVIRHIAISLLRWFIRLEAVNGTANENASITDRLLDMTEHSMAVATPYLTHERRGSDGRHGSWNSWLSLLQSNHATQGKQWTAAQHARRWQLAHWWSLPRDGMLRQRPSMRILVKAFEIGAANEHDVMEHFLQVDQEVTGEGRTIKRSANYHELRQISRQQISKNIKFAELPALQALVQRIRERVLEIELQRGDMPTAASKIAASLSYIGGIDVLFDLLRAMGKTGLARGYIYSKDPTKRYVFSHLLRSTFPRAEDTPEAFVALQKQFKLPEKRLIEIAMYTPQWAKHVEAAVGWTGLEDAVWWFHAHTRDKQWQVEKEIKDAWTSQIAERTPLTASNLTHGAVDVDWFQRSYAQVGEARWAKLHAAAKFASSSGGHKRAQLYAEAMLGKIDEDDLVERIDKKRNQDAMRALGLLPLASQEAARDEQLLQRYLVMQAFFKRSKKAGAQRRASEKLATEIGMENLARTAGYPDPLRLQWAMERQAVADLAAGPIRVVIDETTVTLSVDYLGNPQIAVEKKGKALKNIPAKLKKLPEIKELSERKKELTEQGRRMRKSLEAAMMRGDSFAAGELQKLMGHPVLKPLLEDLVFVEAETAAKIGYPSANVTQLSGIEGEVVGISAETILRIAHPHDLLLTDKWDVWQSECFRAERIQPFKQLFRELYIVTPAELAAGNKSLRFAGQQVNPRQALALLGQNEWVMRQYQGLHRSFHDLDLTAWLTFEDGMYWGTPADAGGTLTISHIYFTKRGQQGAVPLAEIPPRMFSTVMRNLDLVVSVAHAAGVDPESTMSTKEQRAALVRESADLLKLDNVSVTNTHVYIDGSLSKYAIHLGSSVVHMQPGGYVCIVPVGAAQRGRVFLPFADRDPKSAEIIAKTILLAKDQKIKDPTILQQITRR